MPKRPWIDGREGTLRGRLTELRFQYLMRQHDFEWPTWMRTVRIASPEEDAEGIDAFVESSEDGWLPLQIKSSKTGALRHILHYGYRHCIIIIPPRLSDRRARERIIKSINKYRDALRRGYI